MGKKEDVPNRQYTDEFRREAGRLAESLGPCGQAARYSASTNWVRSSRAGSLAQPQARHGDHEAGVGMEAEVTRLRREVAAKLHNEILRKATVYFAKESR